jgi:hypothetical protein
MVRNQRRTITKNIKRSRVNKKKSVKRSLLSSLNLTKKHAIIIIVAVVIVITISIGLAIGLKKRNTAPTEASTTTKAPTEASTTTTTTKALTTTTTKAPTTTTTNPTTTTSTKAPTTTTTTKALTTTTTKAPTTAAKKLTNTPTTSDDITIVPDDVLPPDTDLGTDLSDDELKQLDDEDQKGTPEPTNNDDEDKGIKPGVIAGVVVGFILILFIIVVVVRKRQNSYTRKVTYPVSGTYVNPTYNPNLKPKVPSFHNRNRLYGYTQPNPVSNPLYGRIQRPRFISNPLYGLSYA